MLVNIKRLTTKSTSLVYPTPPNKTSVSNKWVRKQSKRKYSFRTTDSHSSIEKRNAISTNQIQTQSSRTSISIHDAPCARSAASAIDGCSQATWHSHFSKKAKQSSAKTGKRRHTQISFFQTSNHHHVYKPSRPNRHICHEPRLVHFFCCLWQKGMRARCRRRYRTTPKFVAQAISGSDGIELL
jgi:hypothetical protein